MAAMNYLKRFISIDPDKTHAMLFLLSMPKLSGCNQVRANVFNVARWGWLEFVVFPGFVLVAL